MANIITAPDLPSDDEEDQDYDPTRYGIFTHCISCDDRVPNNVQVIPL